MLLAFQRTSVQGRLMATMDIPNWSVQSISRATMGSRPYGHAHKGLSGIGLSLDANGRTRLIIHAHHYSKPIQY